MAQKTVLFLLGLVVVTAGCISQGVQPDEPPEKVLESYYGALGEEEAEKADSYLYSDRMESSLEGFEADLENIEQASMEEVVREEGTFEQIGQEVEKSWERHNEFKEIHGLEDYTYLKASFTLEQGTEEGYVLMVLEGSEWKIYDFAPDTPVQRQNQLDIDACLSAVESLCRVSTDREIDTPASCKEDGALLPGIPEEWGTAETLSCDMVEN